MHGSWHDRGSTPHDCRGRVRLKESSRPDRSGTRRRHHGLLRRHGRENVSCPYAWPRGALATRGFGDTSPRGQKVSVARPKAAEKKRTREKGRKQSTFIFQVFRANLANHALFICYMRQSSHAFCLWKSKVGAKKKKKGIKRFMLTRETRETGDEDAFGSPFHWQIFRYFRYHPFLGLCFF